MKVFGTAAKGTAGLASGAVKDVVAGEGISTIIDNRVAEVRRTGASMLGLDGDEFEGRFPTASNADVRAAGDELLMLSWNPANQPRDYHPSFMSILKELTPDEARMLRFLMIAGPQPSIDWRTKTFLMKGSQRLAGGINLIAEFAGCTWPDRGQHYLANLNRLGLVRFSAEPVIDVRRYSLLDGHPVSVAILRHNKSVISVYRSIYLSLFGQQFCEAAFGVGDYDAGGWADSSSNDVYLGRGPRLP